jgi:hypothetical protein
MYVPLNPHSVYPHGYGMILGDVRHPSYELIDGGKMVRVHYLYRVGKLGVDSDRGWYAVVNGQKGTCFVESFKYFPGEEYPDNASIESWNDGPGTVHRNPFDQVLKDDPRETPYFLESEVVSPYITLDPGEERLFTVEWSLTGLAKPIMDSRWIGVASAAFTAVSSGESVNLKGRFGVYSPGVLEATFYDDHGVVLLEKKLQDVDPRTEVKLDQALELPAGTFRVSICVRNEAGENLGFMGNAILH